MYCKEVYKDITYRISEVSEALTDCLISLKKILNNSTECGVLSSNNSNCNNNNNNSH